ncbi:Ubiquitin carboxyl-terminal hydrolase [Fasciola gigantica]|uniref:Ubiquitin carboxyl-terminal hydrolase n=1 Tax=Fasciola gigantica TaxID=46835 RepID=A0A504YX92_FASGI|nr:Ubiquitin carboxyl-terminal hydrolase [Fasciola gigantica]
MPNEEQHDLGSSANGNWCLIESDPGVFTELIRGFGVEGLECEEVYDLKETESIADALGLIFLFNWAGQSSGDEKIVPDPKENGIFFAKQVITNACATQAIINILMNIADKNVQLGQTLLSFKSFVEEFDSTMKGISLSTSQQIRTVHNSFSNYQMFEFDEKSSKKQDDVYHFVGYLPVNGVLYELDGLKNGPVDHGKIPANTPWIDFARPILEKRMNQRIDGNFNLMAVVPNRLSIYQKQLEQIKSSSMASQEIIKELERNIENEKRKAASHRQENIRRRHNYLPLIVELLKTLAEQGCLVEYINKAKAAAQERRAVKSNIAKM